MPCGTSRPREHRASTRDQISGFDKVAMLSRRTKSESRDLGIRAVSEPVRPPGRCDGTVGWPAPDCPVSMSHNRRCDSKRQDAALRQGGPTEPTAAGDRSLSSW
ncbi:hypothetical protein BV133_417 [Blastochloris viridis]|uniref:Uncharacterized protein n=1 Tax=Blastochloris viridis TaxID=1079 RepID=A0A182CXT7_BLAVI|nr:hypothetical protein BV133_417 [Blastochloris viridis]